MAINPLIALQGKGVDVGRAFSNALMNVQGFEGIRQRRAQAERESELQPLRERLLEAQVTGAEQGLQTAEQVGTSRDLERLNSVSKFAQFTLPKLQAGDVEGVRADLQARRQSLISAAGEGQEINTIETDEALELLDSNPELLAQRMQQAIQAQQSIAASGRAPVQSKFFAPIIDPDTGERSLPGIDPVTRQPFNIPIPGAAGQTPAERSALEVSTAQRVAQAKAEVKRATEPVIAGGKKAAEAAISQSTKAFERLSKVATNIANFDDAIRALDEGAETGPIVSKLPSFRKSTIELINVGNRLGLDVVGASTFGALSESELAFAKSTALPVNLEPQDLKRWIQRKRDVQVKLADELTQAAQFLGTPGNTVADFLALRELDKIDQQALPAGNQQTPVAAQQTPPAVRQIGRFTVEIE